MSARPCARLGVLAAGVLLASLFTTGSGAADPTESSPAPSTETTESTTPTSPTPSGEPSTPAAELPLAPAARPVLEISLAFDKPSYQSGDQIGFTFTIKNAGTTRADGLKLTHIFDGPADVVITGPSVWGPLNGPAGLTLEPGTTFQVTVSGKLRSPDADKVTVRGFVQDAVPQNGSHQFDFSAPVTKVFGHAAGTVFGDKNGNGVRDNGEELAGFTLTLLYAHGPAKYTATSGADGKFSFPQLPVARYRTGGGEAVSGWLFPATFIQIDTSSGNDNLLIRGVPPLNGALHASMNFTKDSYKPGELAHITVTLSNSGPIPLVGIVAGCNRSGEGPQLTGTGPGWGALATGGITLAAGEAKKFDVTDTIPDDFADWGYAIVACDFGYFDSDILNSPRAFDEAVVPGGVATVEGTVLEFPDGFLKPGKPVAGVKVVLIRGNSCPIAGEAVTGADGTFKIGNVAPFPGYRLFFVPPAGFTITTANPMDHQVVANRPPLHIVAAKGDAPPLAVPTCTTTTTTTSTTTTSTTAPAAQGRSASGLASTGANVGGLSMLGLLALLLGVGVVISTRRRVF